MAVEDVESDTGLLGGWIGGAVEQGGFKDWDAVEAPRKASRARAPYLSCDSIAFHSATSFAFPASGALWFHAAYMSTISSVEHAASQFGLLTSLCAFPGSILAGFSGFVIEHTGFVWFFIWTSLIGIPVALLAVFVWCRVGISDEAPIQVGGRH